MDGFDDNEHPGAVGIYFHQRQRAAEKAGKQNKNNDTGVQKRPGAWPNGFSFTTSPWVLGDITVSLSSSPFCLSKFKLISLFGIKKFNHKHIGDWPNCYSQYYEIG